MILDERYGYPRQWETDFSGNGYSTVYMTDVSRAGTVLAFIPADTVSNPQ